MKKRASRITTIILSLLMLFYAFPYGAIADPANSSDDASESGINVTSTPEEDITDRAESIPENAVNNEELYVLYEAEEHREERVKHYRMSNGSFTAVEFPHDVHYEDNGSFNEIDNTLTEGEDGYTNTSNPVSYTFDTDLNSSDVLRLEFEDYSVSMSFEGTLAGEQDVLGSEELNPEEITLEQEEVTIDVSESSEKSIEIINPGAQISLPEEGSASVYSLGEQSATEDKLGVEETIEREVKNESSIKYVNIDENIDLRYDVLGTDIKEYIILKSVPENNIFSFGMSFDNLVPVLNEDKSIDLIDRNEDIIFTIPAPYMTDAEGELSYDCEYILTADGDAYTLQVSVSEEWLNSEDRVYPIMIDPALTVSKYGSENNTDISTAYYAKGTGTLYTPGNGVVYMGYDSQGEGEYLTYMRVNSLPSLPNGCVATKGYIYLVQSLFDEAAMTELCVSARGADSVTNWYTNYADNAILDYTLLSDDTTGKFVHWDVSAEMKKWYSNSSPNNGIIFVSEESFSNTNCAKAEFIGYNNASFEANAQPKFVVHYRNMIGIDDRYTYHTQNIGGAGTGYVRAYDAELTLERSDAVYDSVAMPFEIAHYYNSKYASNHFTATGTVLNTLDYNQMYVGKGWKLNVQQSLVEKTIEDATGNEQSFMIYTDGDGTEHYFPYDSEKSLYNDEEGMKLTITKTNDTEWVMYDDKDNKLYFYNGYLTKLEDANGNSVNIYYSDLSGTEGQPSSTRNRIVRVTQKLNGISGEKTVATFGYNANKFLNTITDHAGRVTSIGYTTNSQVSYFERADGKKGMYYYDSNTMKLIRAYDSDIEYGVDYKYYDNGSLNYFAEFICPRTNISSSYTSGNGARYWYNTTADSMTIVRYGGADRSAGTEDDVVTTYLFDDYARTVNSYSANRKLDDTHTAAYMLYGSSAAEYTPTTLTEVEKNNRITAAASTGGVAVNHLFNPGIEYNGSWGDELVVNTDTNYVRTGARSLKLDTISDSSSMKTASQTRKLFASGKYTASVYVKATQINSVAPDIFMFVVYPDGHREYSRTIREISPSGAWERLSVTFDAEAGKYYTVALQVYNCAAIIYADDFQLEQGNGASRVSLLTDGHFERGGSDWNYANNDGTNSGSLVSGTTMVYGNRSAKLDSGAGVQAQVSQTVSINATSEAETYIFSGWAKANAIPFRADEEDTSKLESKFKLYAKVTYTDTTKEASWYEVNYNPDIRGEWQYVSLMIAPKKGSPIKDITVGACYADNNGSAYFDNLCLVREDVQTYDYNSKGEVIKSGDSSSEDETQYEYEGSNLIEATIPGAGTYHYTYKTSGNTHLAETVTCEDLKMSLQYNSAGSETQSTLESTSGGDKLRSTVSYTSNGDHISSTIDQNGISATYGYNSKGEKTSSSIQSSETANTGDVTTNYTYDNIGRNSSVYISGKVSLVYTYTDGQVTGITRGGYEPGSTSKVSQIYRFEYNDWGSTIRTGIGDDTTLASYSYAPNNGNLIRMEYGNGGYVEYEYDNLDRIVKVKYNGIDKYGYSYNTDGSLYSVTEYGTANKIYYYNYDGIGRLVSMQLYEGDTLISYQICSYDEYSRAQTTTEQGGQNRVTDSYTYNNNNGLTTSVSQNYKAGVKSATNTFVYTYDELRRAEVMTVTHDSTSYDVGYSYADNLKNNGYSSNLVSSKLYFSSIVGADIYSSSYQYDRIGNIKSVDVDSFLDLSGEGEVNYFYDRQNQLVMECNGISGETYVYQYDTYGNIREKRTYSGTGFSSPEVAYSVGELLDTDTYEYDDYEWHDLLTAYNDSPFLYDIIGNPLTYNNGNAYSFTWQNGRQLAAATVNSNNISYEYNIDGLRTKKAVQNGETYLYYYSGDKLISMTWENGAKSLNFLYKGSAPYSVVYYDGTYSTSYYYITNLQGDVVAIMNASHAIIAEYSYDAWGNILAITNSSGTDISGNAAHIANLNPLRYRGYFYDTETGFYYLQSRYYDPVVGRFINADVYMNTGIGFVGCNMYAYCNNNPILLADTTGCAPDSFWVGLAELRIKKNYADSFGEGHNVPYYMNPAKDFNDLQKNTTYTCIRRETYKKDFNSDEINEIVNNTAKNRKIHAVIEAGKYLLSSIVSVPSNIFTNACNIVDALNYEKTIYDYYFGPINVVDCEYTAVVALYRDTSGNYAVVRTITSNSNSDYNCEWKIRYNYDPNVSFESYAFPMVIGVKH